jgi:hypothetical protein
LQSYIKFSDLQIQVEPKIIFGRYLPAKTTFLQADILSFYTLKNFASQEKNLRIEKNGIFAANNFERYEYGYIGKANSRENIRKNTSTPANGTAGIVGLHRIFAAKISGG